LAKNTDDFALAKTQFIESVDVTSTKVLRAQKIVFFCGGKIDTINQANIGPQSLRSFFHHKLENDTAMADIRFIRAEQLSKWYFDALKAGIQFDNLLVFETQMSYLSALTCIILESPGAIAELGSFSVLKEFYGRLMIVLRDDEYETNSFISLGPLRKLQTEHDDEGGVFVYRWQITKSVNNNQFRSVLDPNELHEVYDQFCTDLKNTIDSAQKTEKFNSNNLRHIFLLIPDLLAIFHCLKIREITELVKAFDKNITQKTIKNCLFFAAKLGLVVKKRDGGTDFFTSSTTKNFMNYGYSTGKFERVTFKMNVHQIIDSAEPQRKRVIKMNTSASEAADE